MISLKQVSYHYSDQTVGVRDINLTLERGGFTVLAGRNGSGKTTLLRTLNGLLIPQKGQVTVEGLPVKKHLNQVRQMVGLVFQDADAQIVGETVWTDTAFGPENLGCKPDEVHKRVQSALSRVGLEHLADQAPHLLSGGEKRRLAIAGVLAMGSNIVLLDEPFVNLDYPGTRQVLSQIIELHRQGRTILVCTHELEKVLAHADRLILMDQGRIVGDGAPAELLQKTAFHGVREPCATRFGKPLESWLT